MKKIINEIKSERQNQVNKWGGADHDDKNIIDDWVRYIALQNVKICTAPKDMAIEIARQRLVKIAALAVAAIESIDRKRDKG